MRFFIYLINILLIITITHKTIIACPYPPARILDGGGFYTYDPNRKLKIYWTKSGYVHDVNEGSDPHPGVGSISSFQNYGYVEIVSKDVNHSYDPPQYKSSGFNIGCSETPYDPTTTDTDGDGVNDAYDPVHDDASIKPQTDTDGDGVPDYMDPYPDQADNYISYSRTGSDYDNDGKVDNMTYAYTTADGDRHYKNINNSKEPEEGVQETGFVDMTVYTDFEKLPKEGLSIVRNLDDINTVEIDKIKTQDIQAPVKSNIDEDTGGQFQNTDTADNTTDQDYYGDIVESLNKVGQRIDASDSQTQSALKNVDESIRNNTVQLKNAIEQAATQSGSSSTSVTADVDNTGVESRLDNVNSSVGAVESAVNNLDDTLNDDSGGSALPDPTAAINSLVTESENASDLTSLKDGTSSEIPADFKDYDNLDDIDIDTPRNNLESWLTSHLVLDVSGVDSTIMVPYKSENYIFDFADYSSYWSIMGAAFLALCGFKSVIIVVGR